MFLQKYNDFVSLPPAAEMILINHYCISGFFRRSKIKIYINYLFIISLIEKKKQTAKQIYLPIKNVYIILENNVFKKILQIILFIKMLMVWYNIWYDLV
ncbi:hypothetical protein MsAg5_17830 [Methanosarcinaceae archaeon Ag5]|uniref:Uncharacterized protein n=1 Tax=Methanolapillus africanus TaxID=3028297 RepID=A0AAE4SDS1_9EURY|nr:hypothetical protein [Methanosarcinaceae archaeon Ag5]